MKDLDVAEKTVEFILSRKNSQLRNLDKSIIACEMGVDSEFLCNRFEIEKGLSLDNFILREKVYRAVFTFEFNGDISVEEVARQLGFIKIDLFRMEFKKHLAIEPGRYRDIRKKARLRKSASN